VYNASTVGGTDLRNGHRVGGTTCSFWSSISSGVSFVPDTSTVWWRTWSTLSSRQVWSRPAAAVQGASTQDGACIVCPQHTSGGEAAVFHGGRSKSSSLRNIARGPKHFVSNQLTFFSQIRISGERIRYDKDDCRGTSSAASSRPRTSARCTPRRCSQRPTYRRHPREDRAKHQDGVSAIWTLPFSECRQDARHTDFDTVTRLDVIEYDTRCEERLSSRWSSGRR
jgi:hypothetical protein